MPWFKVDDALHSHPKAIKAGDEAIGFWTRAGTFSMAYGTDGFIPEWWVKQQHRGMVKAKRLVEATMWHAGVRDGERGWMFHQWRQDSKAKIEVDREKARQRKAKQRESQQESQCDTPSDKPSDSQSDSQSDSERTPGYIPNTQNPEVTEVTSELASQAPPKRGHRIPDDWQPRDSTKAWAAERFAHLNLREELAAFKRHWETNTGANTRKLDWDKAFQNWLHNAKGTPSRNGNQVATSDLRFAQAQALKNQPPRRLELG
jgi:hypothetical protein